MLFLKSYIAGFLWSKPGVARLFVAGRKSAPKSFAGTNSPLQSLIREHVDPNYGVELLNFIRHLIKVNIIY